MAKISKANAVKICQITSEIIPQLTITIARLKARCDRLPEHYKTKSVDFYKGLLAGRYTQIEDLLFASNCYAGFGEFKNVTVAGFPDLSVTYRRYYLHGDIEKHGDVIFQNWKKNPLNLCLI